jgi:acyl carrier protein
MQPEEIRARIREIIHQVTSIPEDQIGDKTSFTQELDIDSLALLEIGVDIDYAFQLNLPDERFKELDCLEDSVQLVVRELAARQDTAEPAQTESRRQQAGVA